MRSSKYRDREINASYVKNTWRETKVIDKGKINTEGTGATDTSMATTSNEKATNKSGNIATTSENSSDVTDIEGEDKSELNDTVIWGLLVFRDKNKSRYIFKTQAAQTNSPQRPSYKMGVIWDSYSSANMITRRFLKSINLTKFIA